MEGIAIGLVEQVRVLEVMMVKVGRAGASHFQSCAGLYRENGKGVFVRAKFSVVCGPWQCLVKQKITTW